MNFLIEPAVRSKVLPIVGLYGKSGSGKTMSSLLLARGLVGPSGRIVMCDTENRRASLFADLIPGGYSVINIDEPFSPAAYVEAISLAEKNADVVCVDSFSHSWAGPGGVLEMQEAELQRMAGDDYRKRDACKLSSWIRPKLENRAMISRLLRCRCALIVCLRGEEKTHMDQRPGEKTRVITDQFSTPIADPRFIFELLLNFESVAKLSQKTGQMEGGYIIPRKITHPGLVSILPKENEQIGIEFGKRLAAWCSNPDGGTTSTPAATTKDERSRLLAEIRDATAVIHHWKRADGSAAWPAAKKMMVHWLIDECGIQTNLDAQSVDELANTLATAKRKLTSQPARQLL